MTLAVFLPTRDGLVIGAESRGDYGAFYRDTQNKISILPGQNCAFVGLGAVLFWDPWASAEEFEEAIDLGYPADFALEPLLRDALNASPRNNIDDIIQSAADAVGKSVARYVRKRPFAFHDSQTNKQEHCGILFGHYDPSCRVSTIAELDLLISPADCRVGVGELPRKVFRLDSPMNNLIAGTSSLVRKLHTPEGQHLFPPECAKVESSVKFVSEIGWQDGVEYTRALIQATCKLVEGTADHNAIGGPVKVVLVDGEPPNGAHIVDAH
jgi:hypothetical protein